MSERTSNCFDEREICIQNLIFIQLHRRKKMLEVIFNVLEKFWIGDSYWEGKRKEDICLITAETTPQFSG